METEQAPLPLSDSMLVCRSVRAFCLELLLQGLASCGSSLVTGSRGAFYVCVANLAHLSPSVSPRTRGPKV